MDQNRLYMLVSRILLWLYCIMTPNIILEVKTQKKKWLQKKIYEKKIKKNEIIKYI